MEMSKRCEKGWKWVKVGENTKMPYPQCGRSIKTYARGNNDAPSITKCGSPVRLDAQIVALRLHGATCAPIRWPLASNHHPSLGSPCTIVHFSYPCSQ